MFCLSPYRSPKHMKPAPGASGETSAMFWGATSMPKPHPLQPSQSSWLLRLCDTPAAVTPMREQTASSDWPKSSEATCERPCSFAHSCLTCSGVRREQAQLMAVPPPKAEPATTNTPESSVLMMPPPSYNWPKASPSVPEISARGAYTPFSSTRTRCPAAASSAATTDPPQPVPTMTMSKSSCVSPVMVEFSIWNLCSGRPPAACRAASTRSLGSGPG
mmetsp:Transcript_62978/g.187729  ORF Transcript_62978/g.187729 Transcript_62978/m.187729 type:complete len:218 (+) Transcript_62978:1129-1782(+)